MTPDRAHDAEVVEALNQMLPSRETAAERAERRRQLIEHGGWFAHDWLRALAGATSDGARG